MLRIRNPSAVHSSELKEFLRHHFISHTREFSEEILGACGNDGLVVVDGARIMGLGILLRVTPGTAAITSFRVRKKDREVSEFLLQGLIRRARETLHRHITCIPGKDELPSQPLLAAQGFSYWLDRETFSGKTEQTKDVAISAVKAGPQAFGVLQALPAGGAITLNFWAVPISIVCIGHLLNNGIILTAPEGLPKGIACAYVSKAVQLSEKLSYFVPEYLANRIHTETFDLGEVTLFGDANSAYLLRAASGWLRERVVDTMNVYFSANKDLGFNVSSMVYDYSGAQAIWSQELTGPMDQFFASLVA